MKLIFTGDINFRGTDGTSAYFRSVLTEVKNRTAGADFLIPNLECPLADPAAHLPIPKSGPNLICAPSCVSVLHEMGASAVTLANNHIGDYGPGAVKETLSVLDGAGILHTGAGNDLRDAYQPVRLCKDGVSVSVFSVCEHEFGGADAETAGSAFWNERLLLEGIRREKERSRFVIVVFHGGNEYDPFPSPDTAERYRLICDMGADCVIGGHTHCPQGCTVYHGKPIVYSMGNFLFRSAKPRTDTDAWHYGYLSVLTLEDTVTLETVPYTFSPDCSRLCFLRGPQKEAFDAYLHTISALTEDSETLKNLFYGWAWLHQWIPKAERGGYGQYNLVSCEAHLSQLRALMEIYAYDRCALAAEWAERVTAYTIMPCPNPAADCF